MKNRESKSNLSIVLVITTCLLTPSCLVFGAIEDETSVIAVHMKAINKVFRELRRQVDDPAKAQRNLVLVAELRRHLLSAQKEKPSKTLNLPESERGAFLEAYRVVLDEVVLKVDQLEKVIQENKLEDASALLKQLNDLKKKGHSKFQE